VAWRQFGLLVNVTGCHVVLVTLVILPYRRIWEKMSTTLGLEHEKDVEGNNVIMLI
jgi:hypothetical protein